MPEIVHYSEGRLITDGGQNIPDGALTKSGRYVAVPAVSNTKTYYVTIDGSDSADGLTPATAFASIAQALIVIGGTVSTTNPAVIQLGAGTFGSSGTPLPNHLILSCTGFTIKGLGQGITKLWGPDAAALFTFVNNVKPTLEDFQYLGSPSGTGWLAEYGRDTSVASTNAERATARRVAIGAGVGLTPGSRDCAYGFRWILYGGLAANDVKNDQSYMEDLMFKSVGIPFSIEHGESLCHTFVNPRAYFTDGFVKLQGGSFDGVGGFWGSSASSGWLVDMQPCVAASASADAYHHGSSWTGLQSETGSGHCGIVRSDVGAVKSVGNAETDVVSMKFVACELNIGGVGGATSNMVDWASPAVNSVLEFDNCELRPQFTAAILSATSANSHVIFNGGRSQIATYTWAGTLDFSGTVRVGVQTFTPIGSANVIGLRSPATGTDATTPNTGIGLLYPKKYAGRERWLQLSSTGGSVLVGDALWAKTWALISPQSSTSVRTIGSGGPASTVGTLSHPGTTANGYLAAVASAASAAATASVLTLGGLLRRGAAGDLLGGFFVHARVYFADASYDSAGASTGSRLWVGFSNSVSVLPTDRGSTFHVAAFNRDHVDSGVTDTNWQFVTNNGGTGTSTVANTGVPFVAQHVYAFAIWCPLGGTKVYWRIQDLTAGSAAVEDSATATLPTAATAGGGLIGLETVDAVSRTFQFRDLYVESDQG